jgi:O-antigen ligase
VWLGVFVSILFSIYIWKKKIFFATAVISIVSFGLFVGLNKNVQDRVIVTEQTTQTGSNYLRIALLKSNLSIALDNPIFGVGIGQNKRVLPQYLEKLGYPKYLIESHAHNQFLEYLANTGFLGLLCFILFYFFVLRACCRGFLVSTDVDKKTLALALMASLVCFMIGSLTECNFNISKNRFFFILLAAWAVSLVLEPKNANNNV